MSSNVETLPQKIAPVIFGCTGHTLDADEKAFFKAASPTGFILFKKNCDSPDQVRALVADLRACVGWRAPILIDQEGGRVQRLRPPHWPDFPAPRTFGDAYKTDQVKAIADLTLNVQALAQVQKDLNIDVNCIPCLDVVPDGLETKAINDRAFAPDHDVVTALGLVAAKAAIDAGITPVMKHIPGHGRAQVDSHYELPVVTASRAELEAVDWLPFKTLAKNIDASKMWGMSAHLIYTALDADMPATLSPHITFDIVRGVIGFDGLLFSDDLFMEALAKWGNTAQRTKLALEAGLDIALFCHGSVADRDLAASAAGDMRPDTRKRLENWAATRP